MVAFDCDDEKPGRRFTEAAHTSIGRVSEISEQLYRLRLRRRRAKTPETLAKVEAEMAALVAERDALKGKR